MICSPPVGQQLVAARPSHQDHFNIIRFAPLLLNVLTRGVGVRPFPGKGIEDTLLFIRKYGVLPKLALYRIAYRMPPEYNTFWLGNRNGVAKYSTVQSGSGPMFRSA